MERVLIVCDSWDIQELRFTSKKPAITDGKEEDGDGDGDVDAKVKLSFGQERVRKSWGRVSKLTRMESTSLE
jgi:hypothetical protein